MSVADMFPCSGLCVECWGWGCWSMLVRWSQSVNLYGFGDYMYMYVSCDCSRGDRGRLSQFLYLILPHDFETAN